MAEISSSNNPITGNGTFTIPIKAGTYYTFGAAGTWDSGSLSVSWTDSEGNSTELPDSPLTANGGFVFCAPATTLTLVMSSVASASSVNISIATVR